MKKTNKILLILFFHLFSFVCLFAQPLLPQGQPASPYGNKAKSGRDDAFASMNDCFQVKVNMMDVQKKEKITSIVNSMVHTSGTRSVFNDILRASGYGLVSSLVDIVATETINLAKIRKRQKRQWMQMIQNECNYTDSISSITPLKDFYSETSKYGALDPSNINFDDISIRGTRNGEEVIYLSCHIDTMRLEHLFMHSKFHLVVDTISFNPYACHLPNLNANGIRITGGENYGRDNRFSFSERTNLHVGIDLTLFSSWINEAVMVQQNVPLGNFKINIKIPDNVSTYHYSRAEVERNRRLQQDGTFVASGETLGNTEYVDMEGDCFIVPRSFMPVCGSERRWGTGEYSIKVKFRESCQFSQDESRNAKMKRWHTDYKQLCRMQKKGSQFSEYFKTLWNQNGDALVKTMIKQGLSTAVQDAGLTALKSGGGSMSGGAAPAGGGKPVLPQ